MGAVLGFSQQHHGSEVPANCDFPKIIKERSADLQGALGSICRNQHSSRLLITLGCLRQPGGLFTTNRWSTCHFFSCQRCFRPCKSSLRSHGELRSFVDRDSRYNTYVRGLRMYVKSPWNGIRTGLQVLIVRLVVTGHAGTGLQVLIDRPGVST